MKPKQPESATIRVPRETFASLVRAVRLAHRDSRGEDRVIHDVTRDALTEAHDLATDYLAERSGGRLMCGHNETVIVEGIETCRTCGMWRTHDGVVAPQLGPWQFPEDDEGEDS